MDFFFTSFRSCSILQIFHPHHTQWNDALSHSFAGAIITPTNGQSVCNIVCAKNTIRSLCRFVSVAPTICHLTRALRNWFFHFQDSTHTSTAIHSITLSHTRSPISPLSNWKNVDDGKIVIFFTLFQAIFLDGHFIKRCITNGHNTKTKQRMRSIANNGNSVNCDFVGDDFLLQLTLVWCRLVITINSTTGFVVLSSFGKLTEKAIEIDWRCQMLFSNAMARLRWITHAYYVPKRLRSHSQRWRCDRPWCVWRFFGYDISNSGMEMDSVGNEWQFYFKFYLNFNNFGHFVIVKYSYSRELEFSVAICTAPKLNKVLKSEATRFSEKEN